MKGMEAKLAALWAAENQMRALRDFLNSIDQDFPADLGERGEKCLRDAKCLSIEVEKLLGDARGWGKEAQR